MALLRTRPKGRHHLGRARLPETFAFFEQPALDGRCRGYWVKQKNAIELWVE
jgi:hypothetical protein